jgi:hypothetical protein
MQRIYQQTLREAAKEVDVQCGGLKHIELAENDVREGCMGFSVQFWTSEIPWMPWTGLRLFKISFDHVLDNAQ